ncbi:ABC transporter substrate-binding protein [Marinomonas gallaica]|uniref:ABC transporter substrate-binding protein n=1 Tax=Marinomonas gallaica TaxID=1806667 RepID=UPI003A8EB4ED
MRQVFYIVSVSISFIFAMVGNASAEDQKTVYMTVWRGCEEACLGFKDYMENMGTPVNIIVRDAKRDKSKLPKFLEEAKRIEPDLVVTWGTSVSKAMIGTYKEYGSATKLGDIPVLFMLVADPLGADIIVSKEESGRPTVTGVRNRISEKVQINAMREYFPVFRVGVLYSSAELNSVLNTEKLRELSLEMGFSLVEETYELDAQGKPIPNQFDRKMAALAAQDIDVVYVGSSSYNLANQDAFTEAAIRYGLPVASAYNSMVTNSSALISVSNKYYRVGQLAANQANKILLDNAQPGSLPIAELSGYSMAINVSVARRMQLYPPIQLLRFADYVNVKIKGIN